MNANEVIANRANQLAGQPLGSHRPSIRTITSTAASRPTTGFPAVMHIAVVEEIVRRLLPAVSELRHTLVAKSEAYEDVVMMGRTHLQDAVPITLGQVIGGWAAQIDDTVGVVSASLPGLHAARARRHGGRHRLERASGLRRHGARITSRRKPACRFT